MKTKQAMYALAVIATSAGACVQEDLPVGEVTAELGVEPESDQSEYCPGHGPPALDLPDGFEPAIANLQDFDQVVLEGGTPLDKLSPATLAELRDSLLFTDLGLASFRYRGIRAELSPTEYEELMELFGLRRDRDRAKDYEDYYCVFTATCRKSAGDICIGDNCGGKPHKAWRGRADSSEGR